MSERSSDKVSIYLAIIFWIIALVLYLNAIAWIKHDFLRLFHKDYQQSDLALFELIMSGFMTVSGTILFSQGRAK